MKKLASLLIALLLIMSLSSMALAEKDPGDPGIRVQDPGDPGIRVQDPGDPGIR